MLTASWTWYKTNIYHQCNKARKEYLAKL
jgi:hypothetical protein